ncbi:DUF6701 domain-containing protein [Thalassotalea ganghwensis]
MTLLSLYSVAQCSSYIGSASINEVFFKKTGADRPSFIEIKLIDSAVPASVYNNWSMKICRSTISCQTISVSDAAGGGASYPWLYYQSPILNDIYIDFANGFDVALLDANGHAIDYISVNGRNYQSINCSNLAYQYNIPMTENGTKLLHRIPDGTGPWQVINAAKNNTPGAGNGGNFPYLRVLDASTEQGNNIVFTVQLTNFQGDPITTYYDVAFRYRTFDNTAISPTHYQGVSQTPVFIPAGYSSITLPPISTTLVGDNVTRTFELFLDGSSGANIGNGSGTGTITPIVASPEFSCDTTFVDGLTSHSGSGNINFGANAYLHDNPDTILATPSVTTNFFNTNSCWNQGVCSASGSPTQKITLPSFKTTSSVQTLYLNVNQTATIGTSNDTEYRDIVVAAGAQLTTSSKSSVYKIRNLSTTGQYATLNLAPGEYWIENLLLAEGSVINISSPGEVKLFVFNSFSTNRYSEFNVATVPSVDRKLSIAGYNNINIDQAARVQALVYARGDITVWGGPDIDGALSGANINIIDSARVFYQCGVTPPTVNHYQILHDGSGLTCDSETVTIMACTNDFDGTCDPAPLAGSFTLNVVGDNDVVRKDGTFINGVGTVNFNYYFAENVILSLSNESIAATNSNVCLTGNGPSCVMTFADAGFKITGFNDIEVAGEPMVDANGSRIYIQAVKDNNGVCEAYFDNAGQRSIRFSLKNIAPSTTGLAYQIGEVSLPQDVLLSFDENSSAQLPENIYFDAGKIALQASHTIPATDTSPEVTLTGASRDFYVRPKRFIVDAYKKDEKNNDTSLNNTNSAGDPTELAGNPFNLEIKAVNVNGDVTGNYQGTVKLALQRLLPTEPLPTQLVQNSVEGVFTANGVSLTSSTSSPPNFNNSEISLNNGIYQSLTTSTPPNGARYSEVGGVKLFVRGGSANSIDAQGESVIGRFIPASFDLKYSKVKNFCDSMTYSMTYMGQPELKLHYEIHALNMQKEPTKNYFGDLAKAKITVVAENDSTTELTDRLQGFDIKNKGLWDNGVYKNDSDSTVQISGIKYDVGQFTRTKKVDGPYDNLKFGIKLEDPDGSQLNDLNMLNNGTEDEPLFIAKSLSGESKIRFGRWFIENAYGPETSNIIAPMQVQYYDGTRFVVNSDDSCTLAKINDKELGDLYDPMDDLYDYRLVEKDGLSADQTNASVNDTFFDGVLNKLTFSAPVIGQQGSVIFEYEVPTWLKYDWDDGDGPFEQNPSAVITFGLYRGNDRIISWREVGN